MNRIFSKNLLKRTVSSLLAVIFIVSCFTGCSQTPSENNSNKNSDGSFSVTDQIGNTVEFESVPEKIVSVYYISTSLIVALGAEDSLVGIEMKADTRELYKRATPQLLELPAVGSGKEINIESIAELAPDVVIIPKKLSESADALKQLGIDVIVVNPESLDEFRECVSLLAEVTGKTDTGKSLLEYYDKITNQVTEKIAGADSSIAVYLSSASDFLSACTSNMYQTYLISTSGAESVSAEIEDTYWKVVSPEQIAQWNPAYWFTATDASYSADDIKNTEGLSEVEAVKSDRIYEIPSAIEPWDYPTSSSVLGLLWMSHILHPELVSRDDYINEAKNFYKTFFDIDVTEADLGIEN